MAVFNLGTLTISARIATLVGQAAVRAQAGDPTPLSARDWFVQVQVKELARNIAYAEKVTQANQANEADLPVMEGEITTA